MNVENIALVRATNVIPFDGRVLPISESRYLKKDMHSEVSRTIGDLLKKQKEYNLWNEEEYEIYKNDLMELIPYSSDYNSMVLFSLNGIVPDDQNNTFSNKICAIIEDMSSQIEKAEFISLAVTDTAIKGTVELSESSIILIQEDSYNELSQEEKDLLKSSNTNIKTFKGEITEAVEQTLSESERYKPEVLGLTRSYNGYLPSKTSEETIQTIRQIAEERGISQDLHFNILTHQTDNQDKLISVRDEFDNYNKVTNFYENEFFRYLFDKVNIDEKLQYKLLNFGNAKPYLEEFSAKIEEFGIDNYKQIVQEYNLKLEQLRDSGALPTPQEIVDSINKKEPINLLELMEQKEIHSSEGRTLNMKINIITEKEINGRFYDGIDTLLGLSDDDFKTLLELLQGKNLSPINFNYTTDRCEGVNKPIQLGLEKEKDENGKWIVRGYFADENGGQYIRYSTQQILQHLSTLSPKSEKTEKRISELLNSRGLEAYKKYYASKNQLPNASILDKAFEILQDEETYEKFTNYEQNSEHFEIDGQKIPQSVYLKHLADIFGKRDKDGNLEKKKSIYTQFYIEDIEEYAQRYGSILDTYNMDRYTMPNYEFRANSSNILNHEIRNTRIEEEPEWELNAELKQAIYEDVPDDLSLEEKAIYIYVKLCKILKYDSTYDYRDRIPDKNKFISDFSKEHMESITPDTPISCYDFSRIFTKFISELKGDIEAVIIVEGANEGHFKTGFYTNRVSAKLEAVNTRGRRK